MNAQKREREDDAITYNEREIFCTHCTKCKGFDPHFWNQQKCAGCDHLLEDHVWKRQSNKLNNLQKSSNSILPETFDEISSRCRVILFNDESHDFNEVIRQVVKSVGCNKEQAKSLVDAAHFDGCTVFEGNYQSCFQICENLKYSEECVPFDACVVVDRIDSSENLQELKILKLLYNEEDSIYPVKLLTDRLLKGLDCSRDRAKWFLRTAADEGKISLLMGTTLECFQLQTIMKPFKTIIVEGDGSPLSLHKLSTLSVSSSSSLLHHISFKDIPEEILSDLLQYSFRSNALDLEILKKMLQTNSISNINFSLKSSIRSFFPRVNADWCKTIAENAQQSINYLVLSGCEINEEGINHLSKMENLTHLYLCDVEFSDKDLKGFQKGFPKLQVLSLRGCPNLKEECLQYLNFNTISSLDVRDTLISDRAINQLKLTAPNLFVESRQRTAEKNGEMEELVLQAFNRVKDRLPNDRGIGGEVIEQLFLEEVYALSLGNPNPIVARNAQRFFDIRNQLAEEDDDEEDEEDEDEDDLDEEDEDWEDDGMDDLDE